MSKLVHFSGRNHYLNKGYEFNRMAKAALEYSPMLITN